MSARRSSKAMEYSTIECFELAETDKAFLVEYESGECWIPKSQIEVISSSGFEMVVKLPNWLLGKLATASKEKIKLRNTMNDSLAERARQEKLRMWRRACYDNRLI